MQSTIHTTATPSAVVIGADDDAAYGTLSVLSVVSLLLGLAAPLALFAPLLLVIPITGVATALLAIRRIAVSEGALIGRAAAIVGLALSVASISAVFTRTALTEELMSLQARAAAREWFARLQAGDAELAFRLTRTSRQSSPPTDPDLPPATEPVKAPLELFRAQPVVHFLLEHAQSAPVDYDHDSAFELLSNGDARIQLLFTVGAPPITGGAPTTAVEVIMQRVRGPGGGPWEWLVTDSQSKDLPAADGRDPHLDHAGHVY